MVNFSAVYEGNAELQRVSENAIFGEATPSANLSLEVSDPDAFINGEEYFIDLAGSGEVDHGARALLRTKVILRWASDAGNGSSHRGFRFVGHDVNPGVSLTMHIANPAAIAAFLSAGGSPLIDGIWFMTINQARGRRPEAEIEIRRRQLAEFETSPPDWTKGNPEAAANQIARMKRALAKAEGAE